MSRVLYKASQNARLVSRSGLSQRGLRRTYTTGQPPPPSPATGAGPEKNSGSSNMLLYSTLALGAGLAGWWYMQDPSEQQRLKAKAEKEEAELKQHISNAADSARARASSTVQEGQQKLDGFKADGKAKYEQVKKDADAKYDQYKGDANKKVDELRKSTEDLYKEATEKKDEKKKGWFSWLGL
ncbi:hypothetical protein DL96DRAFT_1601056 [Flagelloscypha sp. PMI_526]|nr:hypothetical protein DL96DRAFT_1601056 [Flagelloscypha sp. PMI_526]